MLEQPDFATAPVKVGALYRVTAARFRQVGIAEPLLEAELLVRAFFGLSRVEMHLDRRDICADELRAYSLLVARRLKREPLAYIVAEKEFWSLSFKVTPAVLIPRPETELLIEEVLARVPEPADFTGAILDLGSGSGVIPVVLARELPKARLVAVDLSTAALAVAAENATRHGVAERIAWLVSDWFRALAPASQFSFIVANPPYVAEPLRQKLQPELAFEPPEALFSGDDGLNDIRQIVLQSPPYLAPSGWLIMEIGYDQGDLVRALLNAQPDLQTVVIIKDYAGLDRLAVAQKITQSAPAATYKVSL